MFSLQKLEEVVLPGSHTNTALRVCVCVRTGLEGPRGLAGLAWLLFFYEPPDVEHHLAEALHPCLFGSRGTLNPTSGHK